MVDTTADSDRMERGDPPDGWARSRGLLRALRAVMAASGAVQARCDQVVELVAETFAAEVCSLYLLKADEQLELYATRGLRPEAVHMTRLRLGEGLIGLIAERRAPLTLADAQAHPSFAYRPETGEEIFQSLMGVPIGRGGRVLGVIAVQNVQPRFYGEDEVEMLETVAMALAELLAFAAVPQAQGGQRRLPTRLAASCLSEGLAMGQAVLHQRGLVINRVLADDPDQELARLEVALRALQDSLAGLFARDDLAAPGVHRDVMETFLLFAQDKGWMNRTRDAIRGGLSAEAAVDRVRGETRQRMERVQDPYLRERLSDLNGLSESLLHHLLGPLNGSAAEDLPEGAVLVARNLGPAELLDYDPTRLRAVVLAEGTANGHAAIIARALEIPMVGDCPMAINRIEPGDAVIVDADNGQLLLRPSRALREGFAAGIQERRSRRQRLMADQHLPAVSLDGQAVTLGANAGLLVDLPHVQAMGAAEIGLYRTEIPFMARDALPDVAAQRRYYREVMEQAGELPVTFRTLDIGGDKVPAYWQRSEEENPALGWRALRIMLDRPILLRRQLRALIAAACGRELRILFPMVSEVAELLAAREVLVLEEKWARDREQDLPTAIKVGAMLEVPALLWQLPALFAAVDFLSVGSNDLLQFLFAADRGGPRTGARYEVLSPPALAVFRDLTAAAAEAGKPLSLCGEAAGDPLTAMALIGCGFRCLSMAPARLPAVKAMVRSLAIPPLADYLRDLSGRSDHSLREELRHYALAHGVTLS